MEFNREIELINLKLDKIIEIQNNMLCGDHIEKSKNGVEKFIDSLGRVTIPKSIRKELGIENGVAAKIYRENNKIILDLSDTIS